MMSLPTAAVPCFYHVYQESLIAMLVVQPVLKSKMKNTVIVLAIYGLL